MTTHVLFVAAFLLLPLFGLSTWRIDSVRRMDLGARIAVAGAAGAVVVAVVMALLSLIGIEWSRTVLIPVLGAIAIAGFPRGRLDGGGEGSWKPVLVVAIFAILTGYGILTARESAGDLQFFWAPKAIGFYRAGGIDPQFLADPVHSNRDYPPLVPLLYAWSQTLSQQFSWWGALFTTLLFFLGTVALVRGFGGDDHGAVLVAGTLAFAFAVGFAAGGADPPLVFFETLALCALVFVDDPRAKDLLAAIGLAGAAWTKIEGATFVIAVVIAIVLVHRSVKRALIVAAPAAILFAAWIAFLIRNDLIFAYGGAKMAIYLGALPQSLLLTAKYGLYELYGLPWIVPIVLIVIGRKRRAAVFPLAVAALTIAAAMFFYIHFFDPSWWIAASAPRVLLTPLIAVMIGGIAASRS